MRRKSLPSCFRPRLETLEQRLALAIGTDPGGGPQADISVAVTHSPQPSQVGDEVTFYYQMHNAGPAPAADIMLEDHLPLNFEFVDFGPSSPGLLGGYSAAGLF